MFTFLVTVSLKKNYFCFALLCFFVVVVVVVVLFCFFLGGVLSNKE